MIKDVKDLVPENQKQYDDNEAASTLMYVIQRRVDDGSNIFYVYPCEVYEDGFDMMYDYIKIHKKELKEKGYKIHALWPPFNGYKISWRIKNDRR